MHFVVLYCIIILKCTVPKTSNSNHMSLCLLPTIVARDLLYRFIHSIKILYLLTTKQVSSTE